MRPGHLSLIALIARTAATLAPVSVGAQATDVMIRENVNTVSGVVHDSIARRPLAGATVQLVATDSIGRFGRTTVSDSLGRFSIADVPEGRYRLGFFHAKLDSLGVDAPLREVYVDRPLRVDLA